MAKKIISCYFSFQRYRGVQILDVSSFFREVVEDLRSSLQLSDAQNLALQVILRFLKNEWNGVVGDFYSVIISESKTCLT
jgi:hypothetical protein